MIGKRPPSEFDADYVFAACAQFNTAVEINCRPERLDPPRELLDVAIEYGCWFSIDTDAHATGQLEWQALGCDRAAERGVPIERIINTMSAISEGPEAVGEKVAAALTSEICAESRAERTILRIFWGWSGAPGVGVSGWRGRQDARAP